jgi:hypothetical protein
MNDEDRATLLWTQEVLATLIKRMAGAGILSEHGADALAQETMEYAVEKHPRYASQIVAHASALRDAIAEECAATRKQ